MLIRAFFFSSSCSCLIFLLTLLPKDINVIWGGGLMRHFPGLFWPLPQGTRKGLLFLVIFSWKILFFSKEGGFSFRSWWRVVDTFVHSSHKKLVSFRLVGRWFLSVPFLDLFSSNFPLWQTLYSKYQPCFSNFMASVFFVYKRLYFIFITSYSFSFFISCLLEF